MKNKKKKSEKKQKTSKIRSILSNFSDSTAEIKKKDFIIMGILVLIFLILAIYNLGTFNTPKTYYQFQYDGDEVSLELNNSEQEVSKIRYYTGPEIGNFKIIGSSDGKTYKDITTFEESSVFSWEEVVIGKSFKYIKFVSETPGSYLGEVQLYDKYGNKLLTKASDDQSKIIVDEPETVPVQINHLNSAYFDEIYFARSAYEYVHGIDTMEWVHPPIGKLIIAIPILLFGMSTFSYRIMGVIAAAIMIPVIYILAKKMFKDRKWGVLAGLLMTFDCFHFAQGRMGTVDTFLVLFIMLSSLFMYQYIDSKENKKHKLVNLCLSGLFIGLAIATKWTGLYAGLALAIIFFTHLIYSHIKDEKIKVKKIDIYRNILTVLSLFGILPIAIYYLTLLMSNTSTALLTTIIYVILALIGLLLYYMIKVNRKAYKVILPCVLFFVLVPVIIYVLSYMLFPNVYNYMNNSISGIINQIKDMYLYHSELNATHDFSSDWYTWPVMHKPVWYYVGYFGGNLKATIVGIGNPAIWWFGIIAFIYVVLASLLRRKKEYLFILAFVLCSFLPYLFIGRCMFMYHYYPTLPFVMLAIVAFIKWITDKIKGNSFIVFYVAVVILMFVLFYPVISGTTTTTEYIDSLKWLSSWMF